MVKPQDSQAASAMSNPLPENTDQTLLDRYQGGSEDAAAAIYRRYAERIRALAAKQCSPGLAVRIDPDDIVQSVFRTFFRRAARGDYDVPRGEELWGLLLVISLNKIRALAAHHLAAKRSIHATTSGDAVAWNVATDQVDDEVALSELRMDLEHLLDALPATQRQMIELRLAGYEVAEIAQRTGRAKRSVERVLQGFRTTLSAMLSQDAS